MQVTLNTHAAITKFSQLSNQSAKQHWDHNCKFFQAPATVKMKTIHTSIAVISANADRICSTDPVTVRACKITGKSG